MTAAFLTDRSGIGVHQRRKFFELRNQYSLTDEQGEPVGAVEQVSQSAFTFLARLFSDLDVVLPVTLSVTSSDGREVLRLRKRWFRYAVSVTDGDGTTVGQVTKRIRLGKAMFSVTSPDGTALGVLRAENWRARDFRFEDTAAAEAARVTKQWRGLLTEVATDADSYAVTFAPSTDERLRVLALAVDLTMKQKDYGSPLDL
jgi:uncharacterized protein YxjI